AVSRQRFAMSIKRLADACHVAVAEDREYPAEERYFRIASTGMERGEIADKRLRGRETNIAHAAVPCVCSTRRAARQVSISLSNLPRTSRISVSSSMAPASHRRDVSSHIVRQTAKPRLFVLLRGGGTQ